jgi:hypothetical protein
MMNGSGHSARLPGTAIVIVPQDVPQMLANACCLTLVASGSKVNMLRAVLNSMFADLSGGASAANDKPDVVLETLQVGAHCVRFYVDFGADSAVLGFSVEGDSGHQRYFPMYGSTYRGLPSVTLEVLVSDTQEVMWVQSDWFGYEILAYHRLATDLCMTQYGEITSSDKPTPDIIVGGTIRFPTMDTEKLSKTLTLKYDTARA